MKITDLLKKVSLVAAVSAFALPAYASDHELDVEEVLDAPKVHATAVFGPLTFNIVDHPSGKRKIMTVTNFDVSSIFVEVDGYTGRHSYYTVIGDEEPMKSSNGLFKNLDLSEFMNEEKTFSDAIKNKVDNFLGSIADTEEHAREIAQEKALAKKAKAEEAQVLEEERLKLEALSLEAENQREVVVVGEEKKEVVVVSEEKKDDVVGDEL